MSGKCVCTHEIILPVCHNLKLEGDYTIREGDEFQIVENTSAYVRIASHEGIGAYIVPSAFRHHFEIEEET